LIIKSPTKQAHMGTTSEVKTKVKTKTSKAKVVLGLESHLNAGFLF